MNIGYFGGTFDPFHNGHLQVVHTALEGGFLDLIVVVPTYKPFWKPTQKTPYRDRLNMTKLGLKSVPKTKVVDLSFYSNDLDSSSYMTLKNLKKIYQSAELFLVVGSDVVENLTSWHKSGELRKICEVVVVKRPDTNLNLESMPKNHPAKEALVLGSSGVDVSGTKIREKWVLKTTTSLPKEVKRYILENKLYT